MLAQHTVSTFLGYCANSLVLCCCQLCLHFCIVAMPFNYFVLVQETYVVMEWCGGGSLDEAVAKQRFHVSTAWGQKADALIISVTLSDVAYGMAYLHQMHIVHRDLKLKNVLLKPSKVCFQFALSALLVGMSCSCC